ncbi:unnamed protein product [Fusarium equiseti]|uniref:Uncharacterized protein n=1 Tax=Fusarium equiseti TaxID=61235 RepID=A0A8J2NPS4_FUSEQ|nr:unnamed protein product [Fusarium equiseti]
MPLTWFITGCSSGFGESLARQLRAAGDNVIATGRNADTKLAHLKDTGAEIIDLDVTAPVAEIEAVADRAWGIYDGIDVVINNAGFILSGPVEEQTQEDMERSFGVNFHGPMNITRAFLPYMKKRRSGTLLYVSSQSAWHSDPGASSYCATNITGTVECLAKELAIVAPTIKLLMVEPGYCRTPVFDKVKHVARSLPEYAPFNDAVLQAESVLTANSPGDPEVAVARMIELVKGIGFAEGKKVPLRVPLGSDSLERIMAKCQETLDICREWEDTARSIDYKIESAA